MKFITLLTCNILYVTYLHIYKITRPPKGVGGGEGGGSYCADKCTVQYSRPLFYRQQKLCLALFRILTLRLKFTAKTWKGPTWQKCKSYIWFGSKGAPYKQKNRRALQSLWLKLPRFRVVQNTFYVHYKVALLKCFLKIVRHGPRHCKYREFTTLKRLLHEIKIG